MNNNLLHDLKVAGDAKKSNVSNKIEETTDFQKKMEDYKQENLNRMNIEKSGVKKLVDFKASGKLHSTKTVMLSELVEKGKIDVSINYTPFYQKPPSEKLKALDEVINNCLPRNIMDEFKSKPSKSVNYEINLAKSKDSKDSRSNYLILDRQRKVIKKLKNLGEKLNENRVYDLSRTLSQSHIDINQLRTSVDFKKGMHINHKTERLSPVLIRTPAFNLTSHGRIIFRDNSIGTSVGERKDSELATTSKFRESLQLDFEPKIHRIKLGVQSSKNLGRNNSKNLSKLAGHHIFVSEEKE